MESQRRPMDPKAKIAFIVNDTDFFLSHRVSLAEKCQEDFEIVVILPRSPKNQSVRDLGFRVVEYPLQKTGTNPLGEMVCIYKLFRILRREKPHLVHNFTIKPALYGSLASRWAGVPNIIVTITGLGYVYVSESKKSQILRSFVNVLYKWAMQTPKVRVIFQNPDDQNLFTDKEFVAKYRTTTIPGSGVDPKAFYPKEKSVSDSDFRILVPCRMLWDKGVGDIVEAFLKLDLPKNYKLILSGQSLPQNPSGISEKQLRAWEKQGEIFWLGHTSDMNTLYNDADIVCLPSYREGLPLALLEASLCQKPILTTDVPGCNFLIQNNINGLLVPAKAPDQLAVALKSLIDQPALRKKLAENARKIALENFTTESINQQILGFYNAREQFENQNA